MKIVAITSCIAGLAHTPMAAKALEQAASKMGHEIKVEQQGAMGQVNAITKEEAKSADFVLIASDQTISGMERFDGKKVIKVKIGVALKKPEAVLTKCIEAIS
ncbi:PTS system, Fru family, IIB component domain protein [Clostridioides difficile CD160]|nr:PTS system, Fru family, IIB component domain protein [Clostridioides difficile CD160]MBY2477473.1 fructose PTS transporter subunit IIB [Clostridioides difficile]